jgi:hypothetical protein
MQCGLLSHYQWPSGVCRRLLAFLPSLQQPSYRSGHESISVEGIPFLRVSPHSFFYPARSHPYRIVALAATFHMAARICLTLEAAICRNSNRRCVVGARIGHHFGSIAYLLRSGELFPNHWRRVCDEVFWWTALGLFKIQHSTPCARSQRRPGGLPCRTPTPAPCTSCPGIRLDLCTTSWLWFVSAFFTRAPPCGRTSGDAGETHIPPENLWGAHFWGPFSPHRSQLHTC